MHSWVRGTGPGTGTTQPGAGWRAFHGLYWLLVIGVIVAVLALSIRLTTRDVRHAEPAFRSSSHARRNFALDILEARYARGEIDRADYLGRREEIS